MKEPLICNAGRGIAPASLRHKTKSCDPRYLYLGPGTCQPMPGAAVASDRVQFGTTSVQLRERKNGSLAPKRHQMKHLEF